MRKARRITLIVRWDEGAAGSSAPSTWSRPLPKALSITGRTTASSTLATADQMPEGSSFTMLAPTEPR